MPDTFAPAKAPSLENTQLQLSERTRSAQFGDGYEQTSPDGLNSKVRTWTWNWNFLSTAQADDIETFWLDHGQTVAWLYQAPWDTVVRKYRITSFARNAVSGTAFSIMMGVKEVFDFA